MKEKLFISEFGLVNALGENCQTIKTNLMAGSQAGLTLRTDLLNSGEIYVADVSCKLPGLESYPTYYKSRNNQLALAAIEQIKTEVQDVLKTVERHRVAVVVGTSTSGIAEGEQAMSSHTLVNETPTFSDDYDYSQQEMFNLADFIATELELNGLTYTISTACSSSAKAFATAYELIESNMADAAVVGGVDALCRMTVNGFSALDSTSAGISLPSSKNRDGINIGEAAALCVLRKDKGKIKLLGVGESSDAHHMSAPHPEGEGAVVAMQKALVQAGLKPIDIDYINLHGTATPKNDEMEALAINKVFGLTTPCSSSKGMIGHTLGAAGATEVGLCWLLLQDNAYYAPHLWDGIADPTIPQLNLVEGGDKKSGQIKNCLSNSFAFGGNNVSVLIGL